MTRFPATGLTQSRWMKVRAQVPMYQRKDIAKKISLCKSLITLSQIFKTLLPVNVFPRFCGERGRHFSLQEMANVRRQEQGK